MKELVKWKIGQRVHKEVIEIKKKTDRDFPGGPVAMTVHASNAGGWGSIAAQGTKTPHATAKSSHATIKILNIAMKIKDLAYHNQDPAQPNK